MGQQSYPNDFGRSHFVRQLAQSHGDLAAAELEKRQVTATVAGRVVRREQAGDETSAMIEDGSGVIQICVSDAASGASAHAAFRQWALGDIVGVMGILYRTPAGVLTLRAHDLRRLTPALRPVPDQGELRRLVPLRARLIAGIRDLMRGTQYLEVETPLLHPVADPADAAPLQTYHNALEMKLYLRRSAASHLQQLLIGGMEKVFEINRSFYGAERRVEVTSMEIYCAYANHLYMMGLLERLVAHATRHALGSTMISREGKDLDFGGAFARVALHQVPDRPAAVPTFVVDDEAQSFRLYAAGETIAEGRSVLNDPGHADGRDPHLLRAIEHGMPPAAGARLEIDALVRALTGVETPLPC
jgi:lysyl-tRNA synthetase class 2